MINCAGPCRRSFRFSPLPRAHCRSERAFAEIFPEALHEWFRQSKKAMLERTILGVPNRTQDPRIS
jgi:hypothetical protein